MQKYFNYFLDEQGNRITSASVLVKTNAGGAATIYSDNSGTITANPLTTDGSGYFEFYAPNGTYTLELSKTGYTTVIITAVLLDDPSGASIAALRAAGVPTTDNATISILGDGGGLFYWDASSTDADDGGITVLPTGYAGTGRWKRVYSGAVNVKWFGAKGDGVTDDTTAIQNANDAVGTSGALYFPAGIYLVTSSLLPAADNAGGNITGLTWYGDGDQSIIYSNTDIEQVAYGNTTTTTTGISRFTIRDMQFLRDTITTQTKFNIRLTAAANCQLLRLYIENPENAKTNIAGIWLSASSAMSYPGSVNFIQHIRTVGGAIFLEARDCKVSDSWFWGQNLQYSVMSSNGGNIFTNVTVIPSSVSGGFVINSSAPNNKLNGCTIDGSTTGVVSGHGIVADRAYGLQVIGCDLYSVSSGHAIYFKDMLYATVRGNYFKDNNRDDNSFDDIRVESITFASQGNLFQGNTFYQSGSKTNKGYAFREVNGGAAPGANKFLDNFIQGSSGYQTTAVSRVNTSTEVRGNTGQNSHARRTGQITIAAGVNPSGSISHGSPYDPPIADMKITPSNNWDGLGCTGWYLQRSSATVMTLFLRGTTTGDITFEWEVDSP